mmetsp:Transcript_4265/g.6272  ORF Transcript_4265/g.6272 Transcript_4265/m.6272 type:complete len:100 (-) Transcript_4265:307-606(-)
MSAEAEVCESLSKCSGSLSGKWFSFYDQAFKVDLDNGMRFITNYKYALKEYVDSDPLKDGIKKLAELDTDDYDKFYSICDKTMVGFVQQRGSPSTMDNH